MGVRSCLLVFLWVILLGACVSIVLPVYGKGGGTLCDVPGCNCTTRIKNNIWKVVNCTLDSHQDVRLFSGTVPEEIVEIFIEGGQSLLLQSKSFNSMPGLDIFYVHGAKTIEIEKEAFHNVTSPSLLIKIENCDQLIIKTGAFDGTLQAAIQTEIIRTTLVHIEKEAFSRYSSGNFDYVSQLLLDETAFKFEHQTLSHHGAATKISFNNSVIPKIPHNAFSSSLASISIQNSKIGRIEPDAFKANEIDVIIFFNSEIEEISGGAFSSMTLIKVLTITKCKIHKLCKGAVKGGFTTVTIEHSKIGVIESVSVNNTSANVNIVGNEVGYFNEAGFVLNSWSNVNFEQNIIQYVGPHFLELLGSESGVDFHFINNDIQLLDNRSLSFMEDLENNVLKLSNNFFNETCNCDFEERMQALTGTNKYTRYLVETTFCIVDEFLSKCYELNQGLINIQNYSELVCLQKSDVICEIIVENNTASDNTNNFSSNNNNNDSASKTSWIILIITLVGLAIISVIATFIFLLLKGGRWLKRKGYFRNIHYNQNERSNDEENTIVTVDDNEPLEIPDELSFEFLQQLRKRLDDPNTKEDATEMIERLYEMFIVEDSYENNNRQDEEAHLYEELGNLQQQLQQLDQEPDKLQNYDGPMSILRLMEEKFNNIQANENDQDRPALAGEYSEPSDAAVHLYSELQQQAKEEEKKASLKSSNSVNMVLRPLPDKPTGYDLQIPSSSK